MEKRTMNMVKWTTGLLSLVSLVSGCQSNKGDVRIGDCTYSSEAIEYVSKEKRSRGDDYTFNVTNRKEDEESCKRYAGEDNYLTLDETKKGFKSAAGGSKHQ